MVWRIEVKHREGVFDALGEGTKKDIIDLGFAAVEDVHVIRVYNLVGELTEHQVQTVASELLADPVTQEFSFQRSNRVKSPKDAKDFHTIEIAYNRGVMDPVEASTIKAIRDLGFQKIEAVTTTKKYTLRGPLASKNIELITEKVLSNKLIQHVVKHPVDDKDFVIAAAENRFNLVLVDLLSANDKKLMELSAKGQLFLNLNEMRTIQAHFKKIDRNPTDVELETIAQTWSEHCYHKTFRSNIDFEYRDKGKIKKRTIKNLLKSTIVKATMEINKSWCVSVFHDNAGVIKFDKDHHVCFKVETHNHPSALEPYGGASTGIGGVIRDILGTGLGAKPICSTDVFCFAPPDMSFDELPAGTLHPKRVMKGVVSGVRDYGNKMGIPTVNGSVLFDKGFVGNPLVYCGCVGLMPKDKVYKKVNKGDLVVVVGGRTGRDGIHGATFSSGELTSESEVVSSGAVQIGDPIQEKKVLDALLQARDKNLYSAVTDCGAGGLSSAVGEMGSGLGARVNLEKAPLKYQGLSYAEIWISESQERMVLSVPPSNIDKLLEVFAVENVEAAVIGEFSGTQKLELFFNDVQVADLDMHFLHEGTPKIAKKAIWVEPKHSEPVLPEADQWDDQLLKALSHYNVCSKEWIVRQYDHEVQGGSIIKPLVGEKNDGPSDASVIVPKLGTKKGIAVSNGINFRYGMIDPFWMAASCIDEAIRQVIAVGGRPDHIAILDNFCWGNPDKPDRLGGLVRAAEGCYETAVGYATPFISGKDSLYNEYTQGDKSIAIPGTILISAIGIVDDITKTVTMDFKRAGNLIYVVGTTYNEMGGSIYYDMLGSVGSVVPRVDTKKGKAIFSAMASSIQKGYVVSAHDCSEGGFGVALAEMAFSGGLGAKVKLYKMPYESTINREDVLLFSESNTRFIVEVHPEHQKQFEKQLKGVAYGKIGTVEEKPMLIVKGFKDQICINAKIQDLKEAWQKPLRW